MSDRTNVTGAGINIAQRVMDCGDAGHILLSKRAAEDLVHSRKWQPYLHDVGECAVKHNVSIFVVNFYNDEVGNPDLPQKFKQAQEEKTPTFGASRPAPILRRSRVLIGAGVLLIAALLLTMWFHSRNHTANGLDTEIGSRMAEGIKAKVNAEIQSRLDENLKGKAATIAPEKSIAVLPFDNLSRDPDNAYFADGIQEEILGRLSKIADLKVISRTSTQRYRSRPDNLLEVAKQLGVAHILEGTVQKAADQVRVNVQLINALNDSHLWADKFDRKLTDIFAVESEIATKVANTLQAKLTGTEQQLISSRPTESTDAHQLYLRGRYFAEKRTGADLNKALDYFNQAIGNDPKYAPAYAGVADCYVLLSLWTRANPAEYLPKAKAAASKALEIDGRLAEAHASLGLALFHSDLNLRESKREFARAIELNPNYAAAHHWLGKAIWVTGEFDNAIAELQRAVELDPFSLVINIALGHTYVLARRYPEAISQLRKTVELDPSVYSPHEALGVALELGGQIESAIAEYEKPHPRDEEAGALAYLGHAYGLKGEREKALQLLTQLKELEQRGTVWAFGFALIYLGLGDKNEAINWLERSYQAKNYVSISLIKVDPMLDPLRGDPRFEALVQKVFAPKKAEGNSRESSP